MRTVVALLILATGAAALASCNKRPAAGESARSTVAAAATVTARKPGLWEQRVSVGGPAERTLVCVDAKSDDVMAGYSAQARTNCSKQEMKPAGPNMWTFSTVCDMGAGGQVTTDGSVSGDFANAYQVRATTATLGGAGPEHQSLTVDAERKGDCPDGMKPGDVVLPDGTKAKVADLAPSPAR